MRPGNIEIEEVTEASDWLGVENYRKRLANAGLSPAMAKVLALEQGETDKLCEYAPRQLLDLVFQVFGDKEVLDAYDEAKRHQRDTEDGAEALRGGTGSVAHQPGRPAPARGQLPPVGRPAQGTPQPARGSAAEPGISRGAREAGNNASRSCAMRASRWRRPVQLTEKRKALARQAKALTDAQEQETLLEQEATVLAKPPDAAERQTEAARQPARTEGPACRRWPPNPAPTLQKWRSSWKRRKPSWQSCAHRATVSARIAGDKATISALQGKTAMPEPDSGTRHAPCAARREYSARDAVRYRGSHRSRNGRAPSKACWVVMPRWCCSSAASDASAAYRLAEKERYRHFIVPELVTAHQPKDQSLLSVVRSRRPGAGMAD
jgi:hypothetical protein